MYYNCAVYLILAVVRPCGVGSFRISAYLDFLGRRIAAHEVTDEVFPLLRRDFVWARLARLACWCFHLLVTFGL